MRKVAIVTFHQPPSPYGTPAPLTVRFPLSHPDVSHGSVLDAVRNGVELREAILQRLVEEFISGCTMEVRYEDEAPS